ncbi:MAG: enoyl-CoA hydratase/isomerase family protein [Rhodobacter sp.]|nr:enoyl-CoA hydratase/isomerase family protein [Rhodobacter sp.]MCA3456601.1 enoyl-CoA hydratase/isomerase family protein [Rhodobacter sp.]MCA3461920.1 enoyl-CoA hydratase/isomerase family protein [Rhodobacter sp.]MCA3462770.1 enoyl-CoA hydratase/isomerase family protein [Rhodobacter sp.]MCA3468091.1 enoyl-CoA hydratase/isomerase family protein [Rhodobacter sp.]
MPDFTLATDADGIATLTWDVAGKSMNVMSAEGFALLDALIGRALSDPAVKGIILTSGKKDFSGGMDLNIIAGMKDGGAQGIFDGVMRIHGILRRIERAGMDPRTLTGGKPIVAALPGTALGIGLELPLACHRIIAADNPKARIGLPEITVGIFPGAGGTTRLVRKLGALAAAPFLLEGRLSDPRAAKAAGLIDEVVAPEALLSRARDWVLTATDADLVKPWDAKGYRMPGGTPYHPSGAMTFVGANAMVLGKTMGVYPAARALLSAVYEGALVPFDTALRIEARWFTNVLLNPSSGAMIRSLFINRQALEKGALRPAQPDQAVRRLGVIGAGMMGAGIAHVAASAGITVVLIDTTQTAAERGRAHSEDLLDTGIRRGKVTPDRKAEVLGRITATTDHAALSDCDLVIEAVFEDPKVKAEVTARVEAAVGPDCILATNTSNLPVSGLAQASQRPDRFIGIHFFSPVDRMMLVEIIRGKATGDRAVAKALAFVRQIGKTPILVNDARFFYANRCIIPYINEGIRMVAEGVRPALIENAARLAGMPLGPLQLVDETSIDLGVKIARATKAAMGDAYADGAADEVLFAMADQGRLGKKATAGFYAYDAAGKREGLWPGLATRYPVTDPQPDLTEVQHRLLFAQVLEAVRALQDGVLADIREGDVGAILGWGFAHWSGGPFSWLDIIGAARAVEICDALTARHGPRFAAPALLRDLAAKGDTFYGRFAPAVRAA